jgi:hypothetical protein
MRRERLSQPTFCQVEHARAEHADADASVRSEPERPELQAIISRFERDVERLTELLQAESAAHAAVHATAQLVKQQLVATQNEAKTSEEQLRKELADVRERARKFEIEAEHEKLREVHSELAAEARRLSAQVERVSEERDLARQELQVATERLRILEATNLCAPLRDQRLVAAAASRAAGRDLLNGSGPHTTAEGASSSGDARLGNGAPVVMECGEESVYMSPERAERIDQPDGAAMLSLRELEHSRGTERMCFFDHHPPPSACIFAVVPLCAHIRTDCE